MLLAGQLPPPGHLRLIVPATKRRPVDSETTSDLVDGSVVSRKKRQGSLSKARVVSLLIENTHRDFSGRRVNEIEGALQRTALGAAPPLVAMATRGGKASLGRSGLGAVPPLVAMATKG